MFADIILRPNLYKIERGTISHHQQIEHFLIFVVTSIAGEFKKIKEKLEKWSYRATPFRVDKDQILEVVYNPNLITKYPEETLTAKDIAYISFKFGEKVFADSYREGSLSNESIITLLSLSDQILEEKIPDIYTAVNKIFSLKDYEERFMASEGYPLNREEFAKGFAIKSGKFRRYIHD